MSRRRVFLALGTIAWLSGCSDAAGPGGMPSPPAAANQALHSLQASPDAPQVLSANQLSFWAYTDQDASAEVFYLSSDSTWQPYVALAVPRGSLLRRPDGTLFAPGDSIQITITLDTAQILVDLEPTGLVFNPLVPAPFKIWYGGTDPDLNGDGAVDALDAYLEQFLMGLWVRRYPSDPWEPVDAIQSLLSKLFTADLRHFSEYAISW